MQWYSLLDSLIFDHASERVTEIEEFQQKLLAIFEAEGQNALCFWIRVSMAREWERKGRGERKKKKKKKNEKKKKKKKKKRKK